MSDVPPFGGFPNLCTPEDVTNFEMWGLDFGQQQDSGLPRSPYSYPQMNVSVVFVWLSFH